MGESPREAEVNALVRIADSFASQCIRQLLHSGRLHLHSFAITFEGVAFDCIAEMFQRPSVPLLFLSSCCNI
ncbi:MAG TPA: hypothetical protein DEP53_19560 [Bacteroidetes bacterium]|nr:hypothetical protein [Bacteroidota bacterium]